MSDQEKKRPTPVKMPTKSAQVQKFMPMLTRFVERDELNEVIKNRVAKSCEYLDEGIPLYPNDFNKKNSIAEALEREGLDGAALAALDEEFTVAGRIVLQRSFGKAAFFHIQDQTGKLQCYATRDKLGEDAYRAFKRLDIGDIVGVTGSLFRTKTGELTLECSAVRL